MHVHTMEEAVRCFKRWATGSKEWDAVIPPEQRKRLLVAINTLKKDDVLGCYCGPDAPCHGRVIVELWKALR
jgi:hypothetical protein